MAVAVARALNPITSAARMLTMFATIRADGQSSGTMAKGMLLSWMVMFLRRAGGTAFGNLVMGRRGLYSTLSRRPGIDLEGGRSEPPSFSHTKGGYCGIARAWGGLLSSALRAGASDSV